MREPLVAMVNVRLLDGSRDLILRDWLTNAILPARTFLQLHHRLFDVAVGIVMDRT